MLVICVQENSRVTSSTPQAQRKCLLSEQHNATDLSGTLHPSVENETVREKNWLLLSVCSFHFTFDRCLGKPNLYRPLPTPHTWATVFALLKSKLIELTAVTLLTPQFGLQ